MIIIVRLDGGTVAGRQKRHWSLGRRGRERASATGPVMGFLNPKVCAQ